MQFDPLEYINFIPDKYRGTVISVLMGGYFVLCVLRRFTPPTSSLGRAVRTVLSGWKHPDELPKKLDETTPTTTGGTAGKVAILLLGIGLAGTVSAQDTATPKFGGCVGSFCFHPSVTVNVVAVSLYNGEVQSTFDPGVGYEGSAFTGHWYKTGLSFTFSFPQYDAGRRFRPAAMLSFAEYARFGVACPMWVAGGFPRNAQLLIGVGADFGRW